MRDYSQLCRRKEGRIVLNLEGGRFNGFTYLCVIKPPDAHLLWFTELYGLPGDRKARICLRVGAKRLTRELALQEEKNPW